jgi:hypothetical protein
VGESVFVVAIGYHSRASFHKDDNGAANANRCSRHRQLTHIPIKKLRPDLLRAP